MSVHDQQWANVQGQVPYPYAGNMHPAGQMPGYPGMMQVSQAST
eukprot:CAMPEP_0118939136 /NCGR_PEP_ID=MMETSP1169-20130426/28077_1 /TAXON_ID=36882 /ORGANISM="Pyramimonas obovata, Strain CCMP722" /LENGTH=43 /DNA_ID= /DNA_START= /DNA_END= /DNA_ORIENTATION=